MFLHCTVALWAATACAAAGRVTYRAAHPPCGGDLYGPRLVAETAVVAHHQAARLRRGGAASEQLRGAARDVGEKRRGGGIAIQSYPARQRAVHAQRNG